MVTSTCQFKHDNKNNTLTNCATCRSKEYYWKNRDKFKEKWHKEYPDKKTDPKFVEARKTAARKWRTKNKEILPEYFMKWRHGIDQKVYDKLLLEQGGVCAICNKATMESTGERLHIDHSHKTNEIRGLLCGTCNRGLGMFQDNPELLMLAVNYLHKFVKNS